MPEIAHFALRLPPELYAALQALARQDRRSINAEIVYILEQYVDDEHKRTTRQGEGAPGKLMAAA